DTRARRAAPAGPGSSRAGLPRCRHLALARRGHAARVASGAGGGRHGRPRSLVVGHAVLGELALERRAADPQELGGRRAVALRGLEHAEDVRALDVLELVGGLAAPRIAELGGEMLDLDRAAAREDHRALERSASRWWISSNLACERRRQEARDRPADRV